MRQSYGNGELCQFPNNGEVGTVMPTLELRKLSLEEARGFANWARLQCQICVSPVLLLLFSLDHAAFYLLYLCLQALRLPSLLSHGFVLMEGHM